MSNLYIISLFTLLFFQLDRSLLAQSDNLPFKYRIAIVGHPANPDTRYDDDRMNKLKELGFNTLQLNIAWGKRPADEALNLEDILYIDGVGDERRVKQRLEDIQLRAKMAKKWGFRTIFHFGAPRIESLYKSWGRIDEVTDENSILKQEIVDKYIHLLRRLKKEIPELDDIQLYTFDQDAWIGNEFGEGVIDRGIPLHERIPSFLKALTKTWAQLSPQGMLWWEPWEMSAGQIYACLPELPDSNFGFFLHSNIAEVQLTRPIDVWFRNMLNLAKDKKIPVVGEIFMGSANEELEPLNHIAAPRLIAEEIDAIYQLKFVDGIKEYYGLIPDQYDPNLLMAGLKINHPDISNEDALKKLSEPFGTFSPDLLAAWDATSTGLSLFPWDATWTFRRLVTREIKPFHIWHVAKLHGLVANSPSWKSTRRSLFMTTEKEQVHPWFFEDIELRCKAAAEKFEVAIKIYQRLIGKIDNTVHREYLKRNLFDLQILEQAVVAIRCYYRESNLAWLMRKYVMEDKAIPNHLILRFGDIMRVDIENQNKGFVENMNNEQTAEEMLKQFNDDPVTWVNKYFIFQ